MTSDINMHRLKRLEKRTGMKGRRSSSPTVVRFVRPSGQLCPRDHAVSGDRKWHRECSETEDEFEARILSEVPRDAVVIMLELESEGIGTSLTEPHV
jgi:hypothetical protein